MTLMRRARSLAVAGAALVVAGACTTTTPPAPPADPLISCTALGGDISYTPPAQDLGVDITLDALAGAGLSGCTDHTGGGVTGGSLELSIVMPAYMCFEERSIGTELGQGTGQITWSNATTSAIDVTVLDRGGQSGFQLELTITAGRWAGARTTFLEVVTAGVGSCTPASPTSTATLAIDGTFELRPARAATPTPLGAVTEVSAGGSHTCARQTPGNVRCWGSNSDGQLGNVLLGPGARSTVPVEVTGISSALQVSAGQDHTCAVLVGGTVSCWGDNSGGELGTGTAVDSTVAVAVAGLTGATYVAAGGSHTCAIVGGGEVRCWGTNDAGQLGDGSFADAYYPVAVVGITGATKLAVGSGHSCALLAIGEVRCWGFNGYGQLGDATTTNRSTPVTLPAPAFGAPVDVAAGTDHSCEWVSPVPPGMPWGMARCWGWNRYGQTGYGNWGETPVTSPVGVQARLSAAGISAGGQTGCALLGSGRVACWGSNAYGAVGNGWDTGDAWTPAPVPLPSVVYGLEDATALSTGAGHSCAVVSGGNVRCWGANSSGQLGDATIRHAAVPVTVKVGP
jgi:alpha-tubulin suppressor-like RCC1 family protein